MTDTTAPDAITQAESLDDKVAPFVEAYEFRHDDGGAYTPNDADRAMLEDAIHGFIAEHVYAEADDHYDVATIAYMVGAHDERRRLAAHGAGEGLREARVALAERLRERLQIRWSCPDRDGDIHQMVEREDLADAIRALLTPPTDAASTTREGGEGVRLPEITDEVVEHFGHGPFASVDFSPSEVRELWSAFVTAFALATTSSPDASPDSGERKPYGPRYKMVQCEPTRAVCEAIEAAMAAGRTDHAWLHAVDAAPSPEAPANRQEAGE